MTPSSQESFSAGNTFNVQMEVTLVSEPLQSPHLIQLSGVLADRNGSKPLETIELEPEKIDKQVAPEEFSRVIRGGSCSGVLF
jgi:hypothetical protein